VAGSVCGRKVMWKKNYISTRLCEGDVKGRVCGGEGMLRGGFVGRRVYGKREK